MKRVITILFFVLISIYVCGCELKNDREATKEFKPQIDRSVKKVSTDHIGKQFTKAAAIKKAIQHHNTTEEDIKGYKFPETLNENEKFTQKIGLGGRCCNSTQLDQTVDVKSNGTLYTVTLTENYNMTLNGVKMISYWKYNVSPNEVKLIDKNETGYAVTVIK